MALLRAGWALPVASSLCVGSTLSYTIPRLFASITAFGDVEKGIAAKIEKNLKGATSITVKDTSGGCGSFYNIQVIASEFAGKSMLKQHQIVNTILAEELKQWHGLNLTTKAP